MTNVPDYNKATNAAYELLIEKRATLPRVDIFSIIESMPNVRLFTYSETARRCGCSFGDFIKYHASSEHGFTISCPQTNEHMIYYNERKDPKTIRFTLPHELGHVVLKHTDDNEVAQKEADCFARNILCPVPVIDECGLKTKWDYTLYFGISEVMAGPSVYWYKSDKYYITDENYTKVNSMFVDYIRKSQYAQWNEHMAIAKESFFSSADDDAASYIAM